MKTLNKAIYLRAIKKMFLKQKRQCTEIDNPYCRFLNKFLMHFRWYVKQPNYKPATNKTDEIKMEIRGRFGGGGGGGV